MARSLPLLAAALAVLVLLAASAAPALSASAPAKGSKHGKSSCPNADSCGLATLNDLSDVFAFLFRFFGLTKSGVTLAYANVDGSECTTVATEGFKPHCSTRPTDLVPALVASSVCPDGWQVTSQVHCFAFLTSADGKETLSLIPLLGMGAIDNVGYCYVRTTFGPTPVPPDARIELELHMTCSQDLSLFGRAGTDGRAPVSRITKMIGTLKGEAEAAAAAGAAVRAGVNSPAPF